MEGFRAVRGGGWVMEVWVVDGQGVAKLRWGWLVDDNYFFSKLRASHNQMCWISKTKYKKFAFKGLIIETILIFPR